MKVLPWLRHLAVVTTAVTAPLVGLGDHGATFAAAAGAARDVAAMEPALTREAEQLRAWFAGAAAEFDVPVELLEAIAFVESRWRHLEAPAERAEFYDGEPLYNGRPPAFGVMGLRDDRHFGRSLQDAARLVGSTPEQLKADPQLNIRGAAALLREHAKASGAGGALEQWEEAVARLSGIPQRGIAQVQTYDVFNSIRLGRRGADYRIQQRDVSLEAIYGEEQLRLLSQPSLNVEQFERLSAPDAPDSPDYPPALWRAAPSCNYTAGRGQAITHVAIHIMDGTYAGTLSWFGSCNPPRVSAHYCVRSSDGQITQMVRESNTAHHVANHNGYTVGIEHEGFDEDCGWYTRAQYLASKDLVRDIAAAYGINRAGTWTGCGGWDAEVPRSSFFKIKGHTNYPTPKVCPGQCWDWFGYRNLVFNNCTTVGAINEKWRGLGGPCGLLGACTTNEITPPDGVGRYTHFEGGSVYWSPQTGAHEVHGAIRDKWASLGWEQGFLRYPTTDELGTPDGRGRYNHFSGEGGSIYWTPQTGAHEVHGAIRAHWAAMGWERSCLGYPTSDEFQDGAARRSNFERGYIRWTPAGGAFAQCN